MEEAIEMLTALIERLEQPDDRFIPAVARVTYRLFSEFQAAGFTREEALKIVCTLQMFKK